MCGKGMPAHDDTDFAEPPLKNVEMPVQAGDDTAHKGANHFHV